MYTSVYLEKILVIQIHAKFLPRPVLETIYITIPKKNVFFLMATDEILSPQINHFNTCTKIGLSRVVIMSTTFYLHYNDKLHQHLVHFNHTTNGTLANAMNSFTALFVSYACSCITPINLFFLLHYGA